jgi:DNA polymerase I-like protein with 3'-5' exonuclease and polymerase domains
LAGTGLLRGLIRPDADHVIVVLDWKAQENAIAGTHSGDQRMIENYLSHDPYTAFARDSGLPIFDAAGDIDTTLRGQYKRVVLGVPFEMTGYGAAAALGVSEMRGFELVDRFKMTYPRCMQWLEEVHSQALVNEIMISKFGWKWRPVPYCTATRYDPPSRRSILNFLCQANGADMLRCAVVLGWMAGVRIIGQMHDAIMLETTKARAEEDTTAMIYCMQEAGRAVTGITLDVDKRLCLARTATVTRSAGLIPGTASRACSRRCDGGMTTHSIRAHAYQTYAPTRTRPVILL